MEWDKWGAFYVELKFFFFVQVDECWCAEFWTTGGTKKEGGCALRNGEKETNDMLQSIRRMGSHILRCVAFVMLFSMSTLLLSGQQLMTPNEVEAKLKDFQTRSSCSGYRFAGFNGDDLAGKKLRFRVYVWIGSGIFPGVESGRTNFKLYDVTGGRRVDMGSVSVALVSQLNAFQNYQAVPGVPDWFFCEVEVDPGLFQPGSNYELVNTVNVFHIGYKDITSSGGTTVPATTQFQMQRTMDELPTADLNRVVYRYQSRLKSGWQTVDASNVLKICAQDSVLINVSVLDASGNPVANDRYNYSWEGANGSIGIRSPDSVESYVVKAQTGATLVVTRNGMCDMEAVGNRLRVETVKGLVPTLQGNGYLCDEHDLLELDLLNAKGAEISWQIRFPGDPPGKYQSYESKMGPARVAASNREHYQVPLAYGTHVGTITYELRAVATVGACEVAGTKEVKMYPQFGQPDIEITPKDNTLNLNNPVCSPLDLKMVRDKGNPQAPSGDIDYVWSLNGEKRSRLTEITGIPEYSATLPGKKEDIKISLTIKVKEQPNCVKSDAKTITLMPNTPAQGIVRFIDDAGNETQSRCAPIKIEAECSSQVPVGTEGTGTPGFKWEYSYEGDPNPDGTPKFLPWGTTQAITAPESVPGTGKYYFREYKSNPTKPYESLLRLTYTNEFGCQSSRDFLLGLLPSPEVKRVTLNNVNGCSPLKLSATAEGVVRGGQYEWSVYDGTSPVSVVSPTSPVGTMSTIQEVDQKWQNFEISNHDLARKTYTVRFKVRHPESTCSASAETTVDVSPEVNLVLDFKSLNVCPNKNGQAEFALSDKTVYPGTMQHKWQIKYNNDTPVPYTDITARVTADPNERIFDVVNSNTDRVREGVLKLIADEGGVCETTKEIVFKIYPRVAPQINLAENKASGTPLVDGAKYCAPLEGKFKGDGAESLYWHFDAASLKGMQVVKNSVPDGVVFPFVNIGGVPENMRVSLVGTNAYGCTDSVQVNYVINPSVTLDFSVKTLEKCNPMRLQLTRHVQGGEWLTDADFVWTGSPNPNPNGADLTMPGRQTITLGVVGGQTRHGCPVAPKTRELDVPDVLQAVVKTVRAGVNDYCAGEGNEIEFSNMSVGTATSYEWDFGDGTPKVYTTDRTVNVKHLYTNTGNDKLVRRVTLRALNSTTGCESLSSAIELQIYPEAIPRLELNVLDNCTPKKVNVADKGSTGCEKFVVSFRSSDPGAVPIIDDEWSATFKEYGLQNNDRAMPARYSADVVGYKLWPNGLRCSSKKVTLATEIVVDPTFSPALTVGEQVCGGEEMELTANSPLSTGIVYEWSFDGQEYQLLPSPAKYTFENNGTSSRTANVTVRARRETDGKGLCAKTLSADVVVRPKVVAQILPKYGDRCAWPTPIEFKNLSQCSEPASAETTFTWKYSSASGASSAVEVSRTLDGKRWSFPPESETEITVYTVTLEAQQKYTIGADVLTCSSQVPAVVKAEVYPELKADFTLSETQGCAPLTVRATDKSKGGRDLRQTWGFGSSSGVMTGTTVDWTFQNASNTVQTENVTLRVLNEFNCEAEATPQVVTVYPEVLPAFNFDLPSPVCPPYDLRFENISKNASSFKWECLEGGASGFPQTGVTPTPVRIENATKVLKKYKFRLTASENYGGPNGTCSSFVEKELDVRPELKLEVDAAPLERVGCNPLQLNFKGKVSGADTDVPFWDFGDGTTAASTVVDKTFTNDSHSDDAVYVGNVSAVNGECKVSLPIKVTVYPKVEASFASTRTEGCTPLDVTISNVVTSPRYGYSWEADGSDIPLSNDANPGRFRYENRLNPLGVLEKRISLTVKLKDHPQCENSMSLPVKVYPGIKPAFTIDPGACSPFTPNVQNSTQAMVGQLTSYTWKFYTNGEKTLELKGNQPSPQLTNPSHDAEQRYQVWLVARSEHGCSDSVMHEVAVWPKPLVALELEGANESCPPYDAVFINKSLGTGLEFTYSFGDGAQETRTDLLPITHRYENLSSESKPFPVRLKAKNQFGCVDEKETTVTVFPSPKADFEIKEGYQSCSPFLVTMVDKSTNAASYKWTFGDEKESIMPTPVHLFENKSNVDAVYTVTMHVETSDGCSDDFSRQVTVFATPNAEFSVNPPLQVFKDPTAHVDIKDLTTPTSPSWKYEWDFGNSQTSTDHNPGGCDYANWASRDDAFAYTINLKVKSPECESEYSKKVFILAPLPNTSFSALEYAACAPFDLRLNNETTREYMDSCVWDFGDGEKSNEFNPMHHYEKAGLYHVSLKAWGDGGEASAYRIIEVYENPKPKFEILPEKVMLPNARVKANNLTEGVAESYWDFGDGAVSTEHSPVHEYTSPGEYSVKLRVKSLQNCYADTVINPAVVVLGAGFVRFPTAFVPSSTGSNGGLYGEYDKENKVFHPVWQGVVRYKLMIFDRWGEKLFESNDIKIGWDGYFMGKLCLTGVYAWRAVGEFYNGEMFDLRGNVTLLR